MYDVAAVCPLCSCGVSLCCGCGGGSAGNIVSTVVMYQRLHVLPTDSGADTSTSFTVMVSWVVLCVFVVCECFTAWAASITGLVVCNTTSETMHPL